MQTLQPNLIEQSKQLLRWLMTNPALGNPDYEAQVRAYNVIMLRIEREQQLPVRSRNTGFDNYRIVQF